MVRLTTTPGLFLETLRTINTILRENAAREPFASLLFAAREKLERRDLFFTVYRGAPEIEVDHFVVGFDDGRFEMVVRGRESESTDCRLSYDFLEDVVDNQARYEADPEAMGWEWLYDLLELPRG